MMDEWENPVEEDEKNVVVAEEVLVALQQVHAGVHGHRRRDCRQARCHVSKQRRAVHLSRGGYGVTCWWHHPYSLPSPPRP